MINTKRLAAGALAAVMIFSSAPMADVLAMDADDLKSSFTTASAVGGNTDSGANKNTASTASENTDPVVGVNTDSAADVTTGGAGELDPSEPELPTNDISRMTAGKIPDQGWTGKAVKPADAVTFKDGDTVLKKGRDFQITGYKNNINPGKNTAIVSVKGIGDYTGTTEVTFTITKDLIGGTYKVTTENTKEGVVITWTAAKNAKKYSIYRKKNGKWKFLATISASKKRTYTDSKLKKLNGKLYNYKIYAIPKTASKKKEVDFQIYRLRHPILQKPIVSRLFGKRPSVYWVSNKSSDGYQLQFKSGGTVKKRKITGGKKAGCKMPKKWTNGMNVRIRCYKKVKGTVYYSAWGKWKKTKVY